MQWPELYCLSPEHSAFLSEPLHNFSLDQHILGAALAQACKKYILETRGWDCRLLKDAASTAVGIVALQGANGRLLLVRVQELGSLLHNGYRVSFPGVKWPGHGVDHPPSSSGRVKETVELYLYSPSGPSWPVIGRTLPSPPPHGSTVTWGPRPPHFSRLHDHTF
jgi:hypothetical protein